MLTDIHSWSPTEFVDFLNEMRRGAISPQAQLIFRSLSRPLPPSTFNILPTELYPHRQDVTCSNLTRLSALRAPLHTYVSRDSGSASDEQKRKLLDGMMAVAELKLKEGAQVMLIKNLGEGSCPSASTSKDVMASGGGLVNGSVGIVLGFRKANEVWGDGGRGRVVSTGVIRNVKLESDGKTPWKPPKEVKVNGDGKENEPVALKAESKGNGKQREGPLSNEMFPLVQFPTQQGSETVLFMRSEFRVEDNEGKLLARRLQVS